ncbi:MAG TPA: transglycosylase SLT domain-containing protein, partial [Edaphobacter sp.]|nr:transglycosylase SLT domain-containing protein [Edaphobacter sp.]
MVIDLNAFRFGLFRFGPIGFVLGMMVAVCPFAGAMEHVTLKNGFELDCVRREIVGDKVRLYLAGKGSASAGDSNYLEVPADSVVRVETIAEVPEPVAAVNMKMPSPVTIMVAPTKEEMHEMLAHAGAQHNIDADLLASVVRAESAGQVRAVSRTGAKGLMQLMPGTANAMGVDDAFRPEQNISGGTAYL